jgi:hypothetical protein
MENYSLDKALSEYLSLKAERAEWEAEWVEISEYLLPGRGIFSTLNVPRKRKLTSPKSINTIARDALRVLTSGIQGGLFPSNRPWLELGIGNKSLKNVPFFKNWMYEAQEVLVDDFASSNFYTANANSVTELAGFGTCALFIDSDIEDPPFQFIPLTNGEYVFATDYLGRPNKFYRIMFKSPSNLIEKFGKDKVSESTKRLAENTSSIRDKQFVAILEGIFPTKYQDKAFKRVIWEIGAGGSGDAALSALITSNNINPSPLLVSGFYEFPVPIGRWETIGSDSYGVGPGSEVLPEIKRLQEMEKGYRMAVHREIDPPLSAPAYMRGKLRSLPGAKNYYRSPADKVSPLYARNFNYAGIDTKIEKIEMAIKLKFFNDIFLTASRDPNASPMKAAEVQVKEGEKLLRLGAVVERLVPEFFIPQIVRCFNINLRKGRFPDIPEEYLEMMGNIKPAFISPLAQVQKLVASKSIEQTLAFIGQAAGVVPEVLDKIKIDEAVDEFADAHGTSRRILNTAEEVNKIRTARQKQQQAKEKEAKEMAMAETLAKTSPALANADKTRAETGQIMTDSLVSQQELGAII